MEDYGEVGALDFLHLMDEYLAGKRNAHSYRQDFFALMTRRTSLSERQSRIIQQAYGDADDYDSKIRLPYTIEEIELRQRVASAARLLGLVSTSSQVVTSKSSPQRKKLA